MFFKRTLAAVVWLLVASHLADTKAAIVTFGAVQDGLITGQAPPSSGRAQLFTPLSPPLA